MFDVKDSATAGYRRVEVLTGPGRRRRWTAEDKARIVAESLAPEAVVSAVARRWQVCPQQLFAWRREARAGVLARPAAWAGSSAPEFVPIVSEPVAAMAPAPEAAPAPAVEVELAGAIVRVVAADEALLTAVLRAVRASAATAAS